VTYYKDVAAPPGSACAERVYLPTSDARLIALDAANGQVCTSFADKGTLRLDTNMKYDPAGYYYSTSPPVAVLGKIIIGGAVNDDYSTKEQSGVIRAFDINTGALDWNWDSGNPDVTTPLPAGQTYTTNSPNSWSVSSVDEGLGLIYVPLGNQTPDQLGMNRSASVEKYSSSIVALDINSGQVKWVRQFVHHDLWDMDVPAQPSLLDITKRTVRPRQRSSARPSRATSTCSTGGPGNLSFPSRKSPLLAAPFPRIMPRRRSRFPICPSCRIRLSRRTCGACRCSTSLPAA
jgi:quinoprotein glucose dehydrogenase